MSATVILHYGATFHDSLDTLASSEVSSNISLATTCKMGGAAFALFLALAVTFGGHASAQYNKDVAKYLPRKPCDSLHVSASPTQSEYQLLLSLFWPGVTNGITARNFHFYQRLPTKTAILTSLSKYPIPTVQSDTVYHT